MTEANPFGTDLYKVENPNKPGELVGMSAALRADGYDEIDPIKDAKQGRVVVVGAIAGLLVTTLTGCGAGESTDSVSTLTVAESYLELYAPRIADACSWALTDALKVDQLSNLRETINPNTTSAFIDTCKGLIRPLVTDGTWLTGNDSPSEFFTTSNSLTRFFIDKGYLSEPDGIFVREAIDASLRLR